MFFKNSIIIRIKKYYLKYGFLSLIKQIILTLLSIIGYKIIKSNYNKNFKKIERDIFLNRSLAYSDKGYWYVNPMPSNDELNKYYNAAYWQMRGNKNYGAFERDFLHWHLINDTIGSFFNTKKTILNFGAGHGGISNIFWSHGHKVINVDPSHIPKSYNERWSNYKNLSEIENRSIDFLYGSHSLEHVSNLQNFLVGVKKVLKKESFIFWEVPNGDHISNGPLENRIHVPHTYYFKQEFFNKEFDHTLLNGSFDDSYSSGIISNWKKCENKKGKLIRVIGKYNIN
jgi:2-polyprenyl-3-methyl-5-hydroxy-6-metoxy-1,4-benzoquinol methylase